MTTNTRRTFWGALLYMISPAVMLIPQLIAELAWTNPRYDPIYNWVSDSGVPIVTKVGDHIINSPLHALMNFGFVGVGVTSFVAFLILRPVWLRGIWGRILPDLYALGIILVGFFPGYDWQFQAFHGIGAMTVLIAGDVLLIRFGLVNLRAGHRTTAIIQFVLAAIGIISIPVMTVLSASSVGGLLERLAIYPVLLLNFVQGLQFLRTNRQEALA